MKPDEACLSDLELDVLLAVELQAGGHERGRAHVEACGRCAARLAQLERGRARFFGLGIPFEGPGAAPARPRPSRWLKAPGALAAVALGATALGLAVGGDTLGRGSSDAITSPSDRSGAEGQLAGVRSKGGSRLEAFVRHAGSLREAGDREAVYPEDQLQFAYSSMTAGYAAVLSRDGAGLVSVYVPSDAALAWRAPAGERALLPESTILDDSLGREDVYALFCSEELELAPLARTLRERGALEAPDGCSMRRIELDKRARP